MERICSNCYYAESTYPLDPPGTLYCGIVEDYVSPNGSCDKFKEMFLNNQIYFDPRDTLADN